jgi:polyisoprenoid-binding protein YceI
MESMNPWNPDPAHSAIQFSVRHLVVARVHGAFRRWKAELHLDETDLCRSTVDVTIEAASIDTGVDKRDADLRGAGFLDAELHPQLTFRSRHIEPAGADRYRVIGDLTIRGITREGVLEAEAGGFTMDPWGGRRGGFSARTHFARSDFGMVWNQVLETGGVMIGDRVDIAIDLEVVSQAASVAA